MNNNKIHLVVLEIHSLKVSQDLKDLVNQGVGIKLDLETYLKNLKKCLEEKANKGVKNQFKQKAKM